MELYPFKQIFIYKIYALQFQYKPSIDVNMFILYFIQWIKIKYTNFTESAHKPNIILDNIGYPLNMIDISIIKFICFLS